jgi:hypothetical protein
VIDGAKLLAIVLGSVFTNNLVFRFFMERSALRENNFPPRRAWAVWWR